MAKAKGKRISDLAKELGIKSKMVTDRLKAEGLQNTTGKAYTASSTVPIGLEMTVRDWFKDVASAAPAKSAKSAKSAETKSTQTTHASEGQSTVTTAKSTRKAAQGGDDQADDDQGGGVAVLEAPTDEEVEDFTVTETDVTETDVEENEAAEVSEAAPKVPAHKAPAPDQQADQQEAVSETSVDVEESTPTETDASEAPADTAVVADRQAPAESAPQAEPPTATPATPAPPADAAAKTDEPVVRPRVSLDSAADSQGPNVRPTVTLENKEGVTPAPQLTKLKPAEIQGPKVVREEAPEPDSGPRRRPPQRSGGPGGPGAGPGGTRFGPNAKTGGGVKAKTGESEEDKKKSAGRSLSTRRRGDRRGEAMEKLREFTMADQIARRDALASAAATRAGFGRSVGKAARRGTSIRHAHEGPIEIMEPVSVKSLSSATGLKAVQILRALMKNDIMTTVNAYLDSETATMVGMEFGLELDIIPAPSAEERLQAAFQNVELNNLQSCPPVVTILGHVDHGKTSLLDKIRHSNVVAKESGGITQHTGAFTVFVEREGKRNEVTFIDTPGHQAFTAMRARGADMTDIVVLVVDAAQGVQPQTVESINHAKAAEKPIVVAMNKIDLPDANPDMVLGQLASYGLNPSEWGGDVEVVRTSAQTGQGIDTLLEILDLQAELMELTADPTVPVLGVVVEAEIRAGLGPTATVLVQQGTLKFGSPIIAGRAYGKVRALRDSNGKNVTEAGPSMPVLVAGLNEAPNAGDKVFGVESIKRAEEIAAEREEENREKTLGGRNAVTLSNILGRMEDQSVATINLILKGDVQGSVETLVDTIGNLGTDEVKVRILHSAVGAITESDVELADASSGIIIGFHIGIDEKARNLAEQRGVEVRAYQVIYEIFDDLKAAMSGLLDPEIKETYRGTVEIREVFKISRLGNIAGCFVTDGAIGRNDLYRLVRDGTPVTENLRLDSLKRVKDDVREVKQGLECGIKLKNYDDIKIGDKLEAYIKEEVARTIE